MESKFIVIGSLVGVLVGIIATFLFPNLLFFGLKFNETFNKSAGYPSNFYSITGGSIYDALPVIALIFGLAGAVCGFLIFKFASRRF